MPPTRFWPRATAMGPATMPRPRRGAGRRPLAHSRLLYAHCLASSPRPAARPCLPWGPCVKLFFPPPVRRGPAEDTVSADGAGIADGRAHAWLLRASPGATRRRAVASASCALWTRRAVSSTSTLRRGADTTRVKVPLHGERRRRGHGTTTDGSRRPKFSRRGESFLVQKSK